MRDPRRRADLVAGGGPARRPISPEVLRQVVLAPRWIVRYRVPVALVKNPHTPLDLALPLAAGLNAQDARAIAGSLPKRSATRAHGWGRRRRCTDGRALPHRSDRGG